VSGQNEIFGVGAEQAQMIVGGAVGAGLRIYLRPARKVFRNAMTALICVAAAGVFGPSAQPWLNLNAQGVGGVVALVCLGVAEGILRAVEKIDFGVFFSQKGKDNEPN
jgi:hypothetical protein